ncbi:hypothetical protein HK15_13030 [Acetobacter orientalis]|uniref:Uncharacterized protein n=1 Tax=Acetobacter orientalis TaxID=146474 RepID=A0A252B338_9PROT|nr:hypothetical protein [Acetobacter orientalis]OUI98770.1 hypothetical protein HK15_13030 [Acetobacter orientalis]
MTDQKPTGVFVRLPLSEEQLGLMVDAAAFGQPDDSHDKALTAIGTPVAGGALDVVAYTSPEDIRRVRKGKSGDIYGAEKWEGSDDCVFTIPLVRQSDAQAQIASLEAEVVMLREAMEAAKGYARLGSWSRAHVVLHKALKGGAA